MKELCKLRVTDPIEITAGAWDAFLRLCEKQFATAKRDIKPADKGIIAAMPEEALFSAKQNDARVQQRAVARTAPVYVTRLTEATDRPILS